MHLPILYNTSVHVSARPFLPSLHAQGWLRSRPSHESDILWNLFDKTFESVLTYVRVNLDAKMEVLECNFIKQVRCALCSVHIHIIYCAYTYVRIIYTVYTVRTTAYLPTVAAKHILTYVPFSIYTCSVCITCLF